MASSQICIIWFFLNSNPFPKSCSLSLLKKTFVACSWHKEVDLRVWPSLPMSRKIVFEINHTFLHYLQLLIPTELMRTTEKPQKGGFYQSNKLNIQCNRIKFYLFAKNNPLFSIFRPLFLVILPQIIRETL